MLKYTGRIPPPQRINNWSNKSNQSQRFNFALITANNNRVQSKSKAKIKVDFLSIILSLIIFTKFFMYLILLPIVNKIGKNKNFIIQVKKNGNNKKNHRLGY